MGASYFLLNWAIRERRTRLNGLEIRAGLKKNAKKWVVVGFTENMCKPAKLGPEDEGRKSRGRETTFTDTLVGHPTVVRCGDLG